MNAATLDLIKARCGSDLDAATMVRLEQAVARNDMGQWEDEPPPVDPEQAQWDAIAELLVSALDEVEARLIRIEARLGGRAAADQDQQPVLDLDPTGSGVIEPNHPQTQVGAGIGGGSSAALH